MGSTFLAVVLLQVVVAARNNSSCGSCGGPVFGMIKQTPCGGSTWFLDLLDADPCSLGFRHGGRHRDGAYRGVPSGLKDLYPSRRAPPPGAPASQGVSFMSGDGLGPNPTYLATHALPRGVRGVAITHFRDPLFVAECELKKKAFQELHQRTVKAHPNAWRNCDGNHLTPETCPFSVNFTYTINAQELFDMWTKVKRDQRGDIQTLPWSLAAGTRQSSRFTTQISFVHISCRQKSARHLVLLTSAPKTVAGCARLRKLRLQIVSRTLETATQSRLSLQRRAFWRLPMPFGRRQRSTATEPKLGSRLRNQVKAKTNRATSLRSCRTHVPGAASGMCTLGRRRELRLIGG